MKYYDKYKIFSMIKIIYYLHLIYTYIYHYIRDIYYVKKKNNGIIKFVYNSTNTYNNKDKDIDNLDNLVELKAIKKKFFELYKINQKFTYIIHNNKKYRFVVILDDNKKINIIKDKLLKIPINNNIHMFGKDYYLHSVYNIRYIAMNRRYFYKTDIKQAYSSINLDLLFKILKTFIDNYITSDDYNYIKQLLYGYYKLDDQLINLNILYQGLNISPILFSIYFNEIVNKYKSMVKNNDIYTYSDDILLFSNDLDKLKHNIEILKKVVNTYNLKLNITKTQHIDIKKDSLIFLNRIIISHNNRNESLLISEYYKKKIQNVPSCLLFFNYRNYALLIYKKKSKKSKLKNIQPINKEYLQYYIPKSCKEYIKYIIYIYTIYMTKNKNNYIYSNFIIYNKKKNVNNYIDYIEKICINISDIKTNEYTTDNLRRIHFNKNDNAFI